MKVKDWLASGEEFEVNEVQPGILKTSPIPANLSTYYETQDYVSHHHEDRSFFSRVYRLVQKQNLRYKKRLLQRYTAGSNLLDYGCGTGDFLSYLKNSYDVYGIEPNEGAAQIAALKIGSEALKNSLADFEDSFFDVITLWHVFEHIPNQEEILEQLQRKLKKEGTLILALPNFESYDAKYYAEHWAAFDVPRHIYHLSPKGVETLFTTKSWSLYAQEPLYFDSFYVSVLSEKYRKSSFFWFRGAIQGLVSNIKALKTHQYSSMIYFIKKK